jgi:hypothetical protein
MLTYHRTYFYHKKNDTYIYLVDEALGIAPYDRVSTAVTADMVEYSSTPMQRAVSMQPAVL